MKSDSPLLFQLSPRTVLRLTGPDRERYLNGQVTQDVRLANEERAVYSAVLNAKGQLDAVCHIRAHDEGYLIDAPLTLRETLRDRLDRYIIADDVELSDESDQWHVYHLLGGSPPDGHWATESIRFGEPGVDLFSRDELALPGLHPESEESHERYRIGCAVPRWGTELTPGLLPPEAGLDQTAISYEKGCYLGQEVISRIKRAGKTNQHLVVLTVPAGTPSSARLVTPGEHLEAGRLTSVQPPASSSDAPGMVSALGYRRRKFQEVTQFELRGEDEVVIPGVAAVQPLQQ